jgi:CheY-like chemotaxis protein
MNKRILVAEDHEGIAETYRLLLEALNYEVVLAKDGNDCIDKFNEYFTVKRNPDPGADSQIVAAPFDLIILDYHLPYKDGIDVARHIFSLTPSQRILIASAYPRDVIQKSAYELRTSIELIVKPFDLTDFSDIVEKRKAVETIGNLSATKNSSLNETSKASAGVVAR